MVDKGDSLGRGGDDLVGSLDPNRMKEGISLMGALVHCVRIQGLGRAAERGGNRAWLPAAGVRPGVHSEEELAVLMDD